MDTVLTLIAPADALDASIVARARDALNAVGAEVRVPDWLAPGTACDLVFAGLDPGPAEAAVRAVLGDAPVDVIAQGLEGRRKRLLVADMDSTIVAGETLDELADEAGVKDKVAAITVRAMNGEVAFDDALHERVAMLAGLPEAALAATMKRVGLTPGARTLVRTMFADGAFTALVSGGFTAFTEDVAAQAGFHFHRGNRLEIIDGALSGGLIGPILGKEAKLETLSDLAARQGLSLDQTLAIGDGANDIPMLGAAGLGIAFHAKPTVIEAARHRIDHCDLTAVLFAQGYRASDFAD